MQTVIVCSSRSTHGNTVRVANALADSLGARVVTPGQLTTTMLDRADLIGFGSGIYRMDFDRQLIACIEALPDMNGRNAFVFATSGLPELPFRRYTRRLGRRLQARGCNVRGTFTCRGLDTWGPFALIGGVSRGRPSAHDVAAARAFAAHVSG